MVRPSWGVSVYSVDVQHDMSLRCTWKFCGNPIILLSIFFLLGGWEGEREREREWERQRVSGRYNKCDHIYIYKHAPSCNATPGAQQARSSQEYWLCLPLQVWAVPPEPKPTHTPCDHLVKKRLKIFSEFTFYLSSLYILITPVAKAVWLVFSTIETLDKLTSTTDMQLLIESI